MSQDVNQTKRIRIEGRCRRVLNLSCEAVIVPSHS
jgi:hypothetical protein